MTEDETPRISEEDAALAEIARTQKRTAVRQLVQSIGISRGTEEVRRVNGIAAALSQRWEKTS